MEFTDREQSGGIRVATERTEAPAPRRRTSGAGTAAAATPGRSGRDRTAGRGSWPPHDHPAIEHRHKHHWLGKQTNLLQTILSSKTPNNNRLNGKN